MKTIKYLSRVLVIVSLAFGLSACMFFPPSGGPRGPGGPGPGGPGPAGPAHFQG